MAKEKKPVGEIARSVYSKSKDVVVNTKDAVVAKLDADGDGQIGIEDIIILSLKTPGVYINREAFLRKQFFKNHPQTQIDKAVNSTPAQAGILPEEIDIIADECIKSERRRVSGLSAALGAPGGLAMAATIPADIIQYYGFTLRAVQKLLYLYGFPDIDTNSAAGLQLDEQTMNTIILCLGTMYGVAGANNAIKAVARGLAVGVDKKLMNMALTKGTIFPIVKKIAKWFGVKMTTTLFREGVSKAIPVVGGVVAGGLTYASFKPCCVKLKNELKNTMLADPNYQPTTEEDEFFSAVASGQIIDATFSEEDQES